MKFNEPFRYGWMLEFETYRNSVLKMGTLRLYLKINFIFIVSSSFYLILRKTEDQYCDGFDIEEIKDDSRMLLTEVVFQDTKFCEVFYHLISKNH